MRYLYAIFGIIFLVLIFAVFYTYMRPGTGTVAYNATPYQASVLSTSGAVTNCPPYTSASYPIPAGYYPAPGVPVAAYSNCPGAAPVSAPYAYAINPPTWYTSPVYTYSYSYPATPTYTYQNTVVYPGGITQTFPGTTQTYQYNIPGYSNGVYQAVY